MLFTAKNFSVSSKLRELYPLVDHKRSDIMLDASDILEASAQAVPYRAPMCAWRAVLSCCQGFLGLFVRSLGSLLGVWSVSLFVLVLVVSGSVVSPR